MLSNQFSPSLCLQNKMNARKEDFNRKSYAKESLIVFFTDYEFVFFGDSLLFTSKTSHTEFHCKLDLPDHTHAAHLVKAQSWTYLFLKSKSCGSCAARRAGLFSLSLECFFSPSFCSLSPSSPLCLSF